MKKIGLTIAGFDPSGGAGVLLDTKVLKSKEIFPMAIITSIVPQNSRGVSNVFPLSVREVKESLERIFEDFEISGIKIGVLGSVKIVEVIHFFIKNNKIPIVYDPVLFSGNNLKLFNNNQFIEKIKRKIFKYATLITPNLKELEILSGYLIKSESEAIEAGKLLANKFKTNILVKGGHLKGDDFLIINEKIFEFKGEIINKDVHGTGCFLSSSILAYLIKGYSLEKAVERAKIDVKEKIKKSILIGKAKKYYMEI